MNSVFMAENATGPWTELSDSCHIDFSPERLQDIDRLVEKKRPETS